MSSNDSHHARWGRPAIGLALAGLACLGWRLTAGPSDIYVDATLAVASCSTYSPSSRTCDGGAERAFRTIGAAAAATVPGSLVHIRQGSYAEQLTPPNSGTAAAPITFRNYGTEPVTITGTTQGLLFQNRAYIVLDGLRISNVSSWGQAYDSNHITLQNMTFERATSGGTAGGFKFVRSHDNRVLNSRFEDGNDNLMIIHSDRNLVQGNVLRLARHNTWGILCGNYNIIRGNDFDNPTQKLGQITDCEGAPSDAAYSMNDTKRNLVEGNVFRRTGQAAPNAPFAGIQYAAQDGIIRRNRFAGNTGPSIQLTWYADEARYTTANRVYHNVMYAGQHAGIDLDPSGGIEFSDNIIKNNILYKTVMTQYASELEGKPVQVLAPRTTGYVFDTNDILGTAVDQLYTIANASRNSVSSPQRTLLQWEVAYPSLFRGNLQLNPLFTNETAGDFTLAAGSPMIDRGAFLARTTAAGSGTSLPVDDVLYFFDGFGVEAETGDVVQLAGQTVTARVVRIDYANKVLVLDRALTWTNAQGVAHAYAGAAPDIGAYESGQTGPVPTAPAPPTNLRIIR